MKSASRKLFVLTLLLLSGMLVPAVIRAQAPLPLHTENEKARTLYMKAVEYHRSRNFIQALDAANDALKKDPRFDEAYSLILRIQEMLYPERVPATYEQILRHIPESPVAGKPWFYRASQEFAAGRLDEARQSVEKCLQITRELEQKTRAMQLKQNVLFVKSQEGQPYDTLDMRPLSEELNRFPLQYFPALTADENFLIFTARKGVDQRYDENIYVSRKMPDGWAAPQGISPLINSEMNEGTSSINADARVLVFTKCKAPDGQGSCDIYLTEREGNSWKTPVPIREVNSPYWDSHPSLSADGRTLFFTSTRPGGQGRMDIWYAEKDSHNVWQPPRNLGPVINTPYDEETPFLHANGQTLYFASDGHPGFGNVDLFTTRKNASGWAKPVNLGKAINTVRDESGLFITASGRTGLFCLEDRSDREVMSSEIRTFRVPEKFHSGPTCTYMTGTVYDALTRKRIRAGLELVNLETGRTEFSMESDKDFGTYTVVLQAGVSYGLFASCTGYLFGSVSVRTDTIPTGGIRRDIYLEPIRAGATITLNNLFFESGKADLLPASLNELRKVGRLLALNPALHIEIAGHTDDIGQDADNLLLSQRRARAVADHLARQGIKKERLKAVGYGETRPSVPNTGDSARALNRRIEFRVLP